MYRQCHLFVGGTFDLFCGCATHFSCQSFRYWQNFNLWRTCKQTLTLNQTLCQQVVRPRCTGLWTARTMRWLTGWWTTGLTFTLPITMVGLHCYELVGTKAFIHWVSETYAMSLVINWWQVSLYTKRVSPQMGCNPSWSGLSALLQH